MPVTQKNGLFIQMDTVVMSALKRMAARRYGTIQGGPQSYCRAAIMLQLEKDAATEDEKALRGKVEA